MPTARTILVAAAFAVGLIIVSQANAAVLVRSVDDLLTDKTINNFKPNYIRAVAADSIYKKCSDAYGLKLDQIAFEKEWSAEVEKVYISTFHDAYKNKVGAEPDKRISDMYLDYVLRQKIAVTRQTDQAIDQSKTGCGMVSVKSMVKYVEQLHYQDQVAEYNKKQENATRAASAAAPGGTMPPMTAEAAAKAAQANAAAAEAAADAAPPAPAALAEKPVTAPVTAATPATPITPTPGSH